MLIKFFTTLNLVEADVQVQESSAVHRQKMQSVIPLFVFHEMRFLSHHCSPQTKSKRRPRKEQCYSHNHGDEEGREH